MCLRGAGRCCLHRGALGAYSPVIIITQSLQQKKNHCEAQIYDTSERIIVKDVTAMVVIVVEIVTDRPRFDSI